MMQLLAVFAVLLTSEAVFGLLNTTSVIVTPDGWSIYPCLQVNHREQELDSSWMGQWFVTEIVYHQEEQKNKGSLSYNNCPRINLYMPSNSQIKMIWHEKGGDVHYNFMMTDPENKGFWMVWGRQTGTLLSKVYDQFSGSVQVIEAGLNRMVLTFCSYKHTHFTLIMVRNATIPEDSRNTRMALINYGLPEVNLRHTTCKDEHSAAVSQCIPAFALIISSLLLSIRFK